LALIATALTDSIVSQSLSHSAQNSSPQSMPIRTPKVWLSRGG